MLINETITNPYTGETINKITKDGNYYWPNHSVFPDKNEREQLLIQIARETGGKVVGSVVIVK